MQEIGLRSVAELAVGPGNKQGAISTAPFRNKSRFILYFTMLLYIYTILLFGIWLMYFVSELRFYRGYGKANVSWVQCLVVI